MVHCTLCRGSGRFTKLAVVENGMVPSDTALSGILNSSILVTGAMLVGTGDCMVTGHGNIVSINASVQTTPIGEMN